MKADHLFVIVFTAIKIEVEVGKEKQKRKAMDEDFI